MLIYIFNPLTMNLSLFKSLSIEKRDNFLIFATNPSHGKANWQHSLNELYLNLNLFISNLLLNFGGLKLIGQLGLGFAGSFFYRAVR